MGCAHVKDDLQTSIKASVARVSACRDESWEEERVARSRGRLCHGGATDSGLGAPLLAWLTCVAPNLGFRPAFVMDGEEILSEKLDDETEDDSWWNSARRWLWQEANFYRLHLVFLQVFSAKRPRVSVHSYGSLAPSPHSSSLVSSSPSMASLTSATSILSSTVSAQ
jgi:hypothetical protein